jgi:hypothetical protein
MTCYWVDYEWSEDDDPDILAIRLWRDEVCIARIPRQYPLGNDLDEVDAFLRMAIHHIQYAAKRRAFPVGGKSKVIDITPLLMREGMGL